MAAWRSHPVNTQHAVTIGRTETGGCWLAVCIWQAMWAGGGLDAARRRVGYIDRRIGAR